MVPRNINVFASLLWPDMSDFPFLLIVSILMSVISVMNLGNIKGEGEVFGWDGCGQRCISSSPLFLHKSLCCKNPELKSVESLHQINSQSNSDSDISKYMNNSLASSGSGCGQWQCDIKVDKAAVGRRHVKCKQVSACNHHRLTGET